MTIGHLGQSLDGFIATHSGDSQFVTGDDNIVHLHRMRALSNAVVVGAGTVATDDPQLTVRHVPGPNPLRVVFDPARRLTPTYRVFTDDSGPTLYVCCADARGIGRNADGDGHRSLVSIATMPAEAWWKPCSCCERADVRGCSSKEAASLSRHFFKPNLLDRLQIAIAPVIIGDGRPAIRLAPHARLSDCRRPSYRVFRMGGDVLFDCDLHADAEPHSEQNRQSHRGESGHLALNTFNSYPIHPLARHVCSASPPIT